MNSIQSKQNKESSLLLLKVQRVSYSQAKNVGRIELLNVWIACLLPFLFFWLGPTISGEIKAYLSATVIFLSFVISGYEKNKTTTGAKIQEEFDCYVYDMKWNDILCGKRILPDQSTRLATRYRGNDLANWYSVEISTELEASTAVLLCQSSNLYWDNELRRKYNLVILGATAAYVAVLGIASY